MSDNSISQNKTDCKGVAAAVVARLDSGSPFSTPSQALNGCETIARLDGDIGLYLAIGGKTLFLRAANRTQFLGEQLPVARRLGRGQYEALASQAEVEKWLSETLPDSPIGESSPNGKAEAKPSLLELALAEFQARSQWSSSDTITIWQNGTKQAWLSRNSQGFITLTLFRDAAKLTDRQYSKPLPVGYWSPSDSMWIECHELRENYPRWVEQARRELGV